MYHSNLWEVMPLLTLLIVFYGGLLVLLVTGYLFRAFGILRVSAALGFRNGWLGFIPYANSYQLGHLAGEIELGSRRMRNPGLWLVILPVLSGVVSGVISFGITFGMFGTILANPYGLSDERAAFALVAGLLGGYLVFFLAIYAISVVAALIRLMVYFRIYSYFYDGQRPIFYMLLSAFVPLADGILLMRTAKLAPLRMPAHSPYGWQGTAPYRYDPYNGYPGQPPYPPYPPQYGPQEPPPPGRTGNPPHGGGDSPDNR